MAHRITPADVRESVLEIANEIREMIADGTIDDPEQPHDSIFELVDGAWGGIVGYYGLLSEWPINPGVDVLHNVVTVLEVAEEEQCVEDDSGIWEGMNGAAVLGCQAFFSLMVLVWKKLEELAELDLEEEDDDGEKEEDE